MVFSETEELRWGSESERQIEGEKRKDEEGR